MNKRFLLQLLPILMTFFAMGFVDLAGTATNYLKADFNLSDTLANSFASMVFFWFLICSVPSGMLMNKIGRRKTVLLSLYLTLLALVMPLFKYNLPIMLVSLSLLGIGNAIMQVSLNPLLSNITPPSKLSSALTLGQFIKAIAAFIGPIAAAACALHFGNWVLLMGFFAIEGVIALLWLRKTEIHEQATDKASSFKECFGLLKNWSVLLCFLGIMCHVGIDVGTNVSAPKIVMEKLQIPLSQAGFATSVYFIFRTFGSLSGVAILAKFNARSFFGLSVLFLLIGMAGLIPAETKWQLFGCLALIGFGNANIFPVVFAQAMRIRPDKKNEISGLMIMGICGGALFPTIMGGVTDIIGSQVGAVAVMLCCIFYLLGFCKNIKS